MDEVEVSRFKGLGEGKSTRMPVRVDGWRRRSAQRNTMDPRVAVAAQGDAGYAAYHDPAGRHVLCLRTVSRSAAQSTPVSPDTSFRTPYP